MKRNEWKFSYPADQLLEAARTKKAWHAGRLEFWTAKKTETMAKVRAEGLEIDESVSDLASNNYRAETVRVDQKLLKDMSECVMKVREHQGRVKEYDAWMQTFGSQGRATFDLEHDDWMFFFGK